MATNRKKRVLVCPLDWGLGHATRCIPIIEELAGQGAEVIIAADNGPYSLLKKEFPALEFIRFPGYTISYPRRGKVWLKMILSLPRILKEIIREHRELNEIIEKHNIDAVISDNRYGLWNNKVPCVFITHQVFLKSPLFEKAIRQVIHYFIERFTFCWIPDAGGEENLSGELSHGKNLPPNASYTGPLSRFSASPGDAAEKRYDIMAIASGPEPQRQIFEEIILAQLKGTQLNALVVAGKPAEKINTSIENIKVIAHLERKGMQEAIISSEIIVCRGGYSTIMDLAALGKKAIFIPTPGQTEQEYLAKHFAGKGMAVAGEQGSFDLLRALKKAENIQPLSRKQENLLREKIRFLLDSASDEKSHFLQTDSRFRGNDG